MNGKLKFRLFSIICIILLCISSVGKSLQNDTFYIIKLGQDIVNNGIDFLDHYCWVADLNYTYPHWLYDVIIFLIYSNFGYDGVYGSTILFFILLILIIYIVNVKINKNEMMGLIISLISVTVLYSFATARAQLISVSLLLLEVYFIEKLIGVGKKKYIFYLLLISLIIANIHATTWLVCFILYLPYVGEMIMYKLLSFKNFNSKFKVSKKIVINKINNFKLIIVSLIGSFFMGIFSPSRICYTYVFRIMMGDSQSYILEHFPLVVINEPVFLVSVLVIIVLLSFTNIRVRLYELFMLSGLIFMTLCAKRHLFIFVVIGFLFISKWCVRFFKVRNDKTLDILYNIILTKKLVCLLFLVIVFGISGVKFYQTYKDKYVNEKEYPVMAVKYIKDNMDYNNIKLYNDYNIGSYLMFNDIRVFIDSRCDLYLKEFNGLDYSIFDDEMNMEYNYKDKFKFYGFTHLLIKNDSLFNNIIELDDDFDVIYKDKYFTLFERVGYDEI